MTETGLQGRRLSDHHPGNMIVFDKCPSPITLFFFSDQQSKGNREGIGGVLPGTEIGLNNGGTTTLHIGGSQTIDDIAFLSPFVIIQVIRCHGIDMSHQDDLNVFTGRHDDQIVPPIIHVLQLNGKPMLLQIAVKIRDDFLFFPRRTVDIDNMLE